MMDTNTDSESFWDEKFAEAAAAESSTPTSTYTLRPSSRLNLPLPANSPSYIIFDGDSDRNRLTRTASDICRERNAIRVIAPTPSPTYAHPFTIFQDADVSNSAAAISAANIGQTPSSSYLISDAEGSWPVYLGDNGGVQGAACHDPNNMRRRGSFNVLFQNRSSNSGANTCYNDADIVFDTSSIQKRQDNDNLALQNNGMNVSKALSPEIDRRHQSLPTVSYNRNSRQRPSSSSNIGAKNSGSSGRRHKHNNNRRRHAIFGNEETVKETQNLRPLRPVLQGGLNIGGSNNRLGYEGSSSQVFQSRAAARFNNGQNNIDNKQSPRVTNNRLRSFSISPRGKLIKHADQFRSNSSQNNRDSDISMGGDGTFTPSVSDNRTPSKSSFGGGGGQITPDVFNYSDKTPPVLLRRADNNTGSTVYWGSSRRTPQGGGDSQLEHFRIVLLGKSGVGKTSLVSQFLTSDYLNAYVDSFESEYDERSVRIELDEVEAELTFIDHPCGEMSVENTASTYEPHVFLVLYSINDKSSLDTATQILDYLSTNGYQFADGKMSAILVGNKIDLERSRVVTHDDGVKAASEYGCKFCETSVAIQHNVDELLVGILKQIRLRVDRFDDFEYEDFYSPSQTLMEDSERQLHSPRHSSRHGLNSNINNDGCESNEFLHDTECLNDDKNNATRLPFPSRSTVRRVKTGSKSGSRSNSIIESARSMFSQLCVRRMMSDESGKTRKSKKQKISRSCENLHIL